MIATIQLTAKKELDIQFFTNHIFSLFLGTLAGTKLLYWLVNIGTLYDNIQVKIERNGLFDWDTATGIFKLLFNIDQFYVMGGALAFGGLFLLYAKRHKQPLLPWMDVIIPAFSIALFFGMIGSFLGGYYVGIPTDSFLGVRFSGDQLYSHATFLYAVPIHPIQLYISATSLITFGILMEILKKVKVSGVTGVLGLFLLSLSSFLLEFLRSGDDTVVPFGAIFHLNQYIAFLGIALSIYLFTKKVPRIVG